MAFASRLAGWLDAGRPLRDEFGGCVTLMSQNAPSRAWKVMWPQTSAAAESGPGRAGSARGLATGSGR